MKSGKQIEKPRLNRRPPFYNTRIYPDIELSGDAYEKAYKRYKKNPAAALSALGDKIQSSTNFKNRKDRAINPQEKY